ncbi:hypothetical protein BJY00DRAFT_296180 [Aspergillus carlsbadensis]|nr:hypothetical protein BJY00DRAFT_296180 [Aspergillus carlsbadensis]
MRAIQHEKHIVARHLLRKAILYKNVSDRIRFRTSALEAAIGTLDKDTVTQVLETVHTLVAPHNALHNVMREGNIDLASSLVSKIMQRLTLEAQSLARRNGVDESGPSIQQTLMLRRCRVPANAIKTATSTGPLDFCAMILPSYLGALHLYHNRDAVPEAEFLAYLSGAFYSRFPRTQCISMLSCQPQPTVVFHLLQQLKDSPPKDMRITAEGETFEAHKDVLAHFTTYFVGPLRGPWSDREHIDFGTAISAATLKALINYLHVSARDDMRLNNLDVDGDRLWEAADYLGFDGLAECIEGLADVRGESEDESWYTADVEGFCAGSGSDTGDFLGFGVDWSRLFGV